MQAAAANSGERPKGSTRSRPGTAQPSRHAEAPRLLRWLYGVRPALMPTVYVPGPIVVARKV